MEPAKVDKAGSDLDGFAAEARQRTDNLLDPSQKAADTHKGWAFSAPLHACQQSGEPQIIKLIGDATGYAKKLRNSAADVTKTDEEAARRLIKVYEDLGVDTF